MKKPALMIGLGEVLWDFLPSGKALGGAPANFAYMAGVLGNEGIVASRVGIDDLGREAYDEMKRLGLNTSFLQRDGLHPTGTAEVSIDKRGQPNFTIKQPVAWDFLQWTAEWEELSAKADVVCFGSLAQRSPMSAVTIECFLRNTRKAALRICDINLRQSYYNGDVLWRSFQQADIAKLNEEELPQVSSLLNLGTGTEEILAKRLLKECSLRLACITRGDRGSLIVSDETAVEHQGFHVKVVDAVGAGDAFTACVAHHYMRGKPLQEISESANRFASWVATQRGATPTVTAEQLQNILSGVVVS
jgi:fructokinase